MRRRGAYNLHGLPNARHRKDALRRDLRQFEAPNACCICHSAIRRHVLG
nr:MAG TPA: Protein of unknown function (DUF1588) [Caudoviricetes sp.]